ncbi:MAG: site-2 protease family protein, partial [Lachnospiraceae bacterium]|nr:site-2 protease family protein [Lachnospiraceae bacterium]
ISTTIKALGKLITGQISLKNNVGGPVRIVSELDNTIQESKEDGILYVILNLLNFAILLSANLGVMNLLPLPALDGGRLIFIIIELIFKKPIPKEKEGIVHAIGLVFFLVLMVLVLFNDIRYVFF